MRPSLAIALFALLILGGAAAPAANAEGYNWKSPVEVQTAMEQDHAPAIFYFEIPQGPVATSITWLFNRDDMVQVLRKLRFACCRITGAGGQGGRGRGGPRGPAGGGGSESPWADYDKLAKELGVQSATALVICSFDGKVLARKCDPTKPEDFVALLAKTAAENGRRVKATDEAARDLAQVEKWIDEKKYVDAGRRLNMVLDRGDRVSEKVMDQAKEIDARLETIGKERLAEGKRLLDAGKAEEATPILEETAAAFGKFDCGKEAKALLRKLKSA